MTDRPDPRNEGLTLEDQEIIEQEEAVEEAEMKLERQAIADLLINDGLEFIAEDEAASSVTGLTMIEAQSILSAAWAANTDGWSDQHRDALQRATEKISVDAFGRTAVGGTK